MTITPEPQGPRLRPGEFLHESSLSSPSGRFTLRNGIRGGSSLIDNATEVELWKVPDTNVYGSSSLVFGLDGDLMVWNTIATGVGAVTPPAAVPRCCA